MTTSNDPSNDAADGHSQAGPPLGTSADGQISDRALRVFRHAANWGSLTRAGRHLGLGQPAVSHAVSRLEQAMGVKLLNRSRSGVTVTEAGARLLEAIEPAYLAIDRTVAELREGGDGPTVSLSVSTSFAGWFLLPRLPDFKRRHPEVEVRLMATDTDFGVDVGSLDLWIPLGVVERPTLETTELCAEELIPVASPAVAEALRKDRASDLRSAPLLHLEERYASRFDWQRWFNHHQMQTAARLPGDRFNDYSLVIQAALEGQGVALGWRHIVADLVDQGRLIALAEPVVTDRPFVIVHSRSRALNPGAAALQTWLVEVMRAYRVTDRPGA